MSRPADRLGPPPLNLVPWGLLDFFGIKNGGRFPQTLPESLAPTMELFDWYLQTKAQLYATVGTAVAASAGASTKNDVTTVTGGLTISNGQIVVPDNEWWVLARGNIAATPSATFVGSFVIGMDFIQIQREQVVQSTRATFAAAANTRQNVTTFKGPYFIAPGTAINFNYDAELSAGTFNFTADLLLARALA